MAKQKSNSVFSVIGRIIVYLIGLLIIALGINISRMAQLGISPVSSIPGVLNGIYPNLSLGAMIAIVYCVLVIAQIIVLRSKFKAINLLGVPVGVIFGWMTDFIGVTKFKFTVCGLYVGVDKEFTGLLNSFASQNMPSNLGMKFVYLAVSILVIGIGVYIYLQPKLVPMPAEGLAQAISKVSGKAFGNCKTGVDMSLILIACVLQVVKLGGFETLLSGLKPDVKSVVGVGTILSAFCVGQVVKFINKIFAKKMYK